MLGAEEAALRLRLAQVGRHVVQGDLVVERQRELINRLQLKGLDADIAIEVLRTFEDSLRAHVADLNSLLKRLDKSSYDPGKLEPLLSAEIASQNFSVGSNQHS